MTMATRARRRRDRSRLREASRVVVKVGSSLLVEFTDHPEELKSFNP
mgnify:CR=1 FL=1